ncbi:MAG: histidine phosphatase family protein [Rhodobacteraceae bacterium]|nr:histidine phosphatase family protein [Paracoccaceae bacterium]
MQPLKPNELAVIRHAPADTGGRLAGRRDVAARIDPQAAAYMARALGQPARLICSPALRCRQTAEALWPKLVPEQDARLWEQDFGTHEGLAYEDLPDLGPLSRAELAQVAAPEGESFAQMVARVTPALAGLQVPTGGGPVVVVAHAGTVRAALAMALGDVPLALAFEVAPLSVTRLRCFAGGFSVVQVSGDV